MAKKLEFPTRKLQDYGTSLYVALPPAWLNTLGLKKGDPLLFVLQEDGNLEVRPVKKKSG